MIVPGEVFLRTAPDRASLNIRRGDRVPDVFWGRVMVEWGSSGQRAGTELTVSVERFLSRTGWVRAACIQHVVELDLDQATRDLVARSGKERSELARAIAEPEERREVASRLLGTRFTRQLRDFQDRDLSRLLALPNGANFSVPGAGKTTVTYALYEAERKAGRVNRLLVVAPLSAFEAWNTEAAECFGAQAPTIEAYDGGPISPKAEIVLTNYHRLANASSYNALAQWVTAMPTHVVLDEAHRVKRGWSGEWGRACLSLAYLAARRDILTGTPAPQGFKDLEALFDFAWPGQARSILPEALFLRGHGDMAGDKVAESISPLFVRTTKLDLGLPAVNFSVQPTALVGLQKEIYSALRHDTGQLVLSRREEMDFARMGQVVMYLLEAACNPQLLAAGSSEFDPLEFRHPPMAIPNESRLRELVGRYALYETPPKFLALARIVQDNAAMGRKTLVWTNFVRNISTLERMLARYKPAAVHGGVPSRVSTLYAPRFREDEIARFRDPMSGCMVLLANPAAMSEGISLHRECQDAVYVDRTFNAGQYLQSLDRIHRLGLRSDQIPNVTFLETVGTIDEVVNRRIKDKAARLGRILDDPAIEQMALPDEDDYGAPFDGAADIAALLAHLKGVGNEQI